MYQSDGRGSGGLNSWGLGLLRSLWSEGVSIFSDLEPRTETVRERKQDAGSQEGCPQGQGHRLWGLCFYRFFFVSFFGLLLMEGTAALGFFGISALLGSDCSASCVVIFRKTESCLEKSTLTDGILSTEA